MFNSILKKINLALTFILLLATYLRLYRINELLGFWYDQGRDALVIWDLIHNHKFFLIGPTTGIEGVFRGPWYYWLITPFYWLGGGNPLYPSVFLIITSVFAVFVLYKVGKDLGGEHLGLLSALIAGLSVYVIGISRWLSNPVPMLLIGISLIWTLYRFLDKKIWALPLIALLVGMALQFGSATEFFYIPVLLGILIWKRKLWPKWQIILLSGLIFFATIIPQLLFELRHPGMLSGPILNFILHGKSGDLTFIQLVISRLKLFYDITASKFWINGNLLFAPFLIILTGYLVWKWKTLWKNEKFIIIFVFTLAPFIGTLFFNGNSGNVYDYYFTGYYFIIILFFAFLLIQISKSVIGKIILSLFLVFFLFQNITTYIKAYSIPLTDGNLIAYTNQMSAIDWIYKDAEGHNFNVDEYVPPVIPYAYNYLFTWLGTDKYGKNPAGQNVALLYTLHEVDPDHPDRIEAWINRQAGIGKIEDSINFGGISVERRIRLHVK